MDYLFLYIEINALCFIFTTIILINVRRDLGTDLEVSAFKWMLRVLLVALVLDSLTRAHYHGAIHLPPLVVGLFYSTYMWLFSGVLSYLWLLFAELRIGGRLSGSRTFFVVAALPVVVLAFLGFASPWTGWFFSIDSAGIYTRGPLWAIQSVFAYSYFLFVTIHSILAARKETSPQRRRQLLALSAFIIAPLIGALLQLLVGGHPLVGPSVCISVLIIFINVQGNMIYHDALTGLNNRRRTDQYLEEMVAHVDEGSPFYLFVLDVDKFKTINDTFGHAEGDRALQTFANALRRTVGEFHGFLRRYGGDEFICIAERQFVPDPNLFEQRIASNLATICADQELPYTLATSVGYAECTSSNTSIADLLAQADHMLYAKKHANV